MLSIASWIDLHLTPESQTTLRQSILHSAFAEYREIVHIRNLDTAACDDPFPETFRMIQELLDEKGYTSSSSSSRGEEEDVHEAQSEEDYEAYLLALDEFDRALMKMHPLSSPSFPTVEKQQEEVFHALLRVFELYMEL